MPLEGEAAMSVIKGLMGGPKRSYDTPNGLNCPDCCKELVDSEFGVVHLDPPRKRVACRHCGYKGFRPVEGFDGPGFKREDSGLSPEGEGPEAGLEDA